MPIQINVPGEAAFQVDTPKVKETCPWKVERTDEKITFSIGKGDKKQVRNYKTTDLRKYLINHYNWNGLLLLLDKMAELNDNFTYTRPTTTDLKGIPSHDDPLLVPDEATESVIYLQAKYCVEVKYKDKPVENINKIVGELKKAKKTKEYPVSDDYISGKKPAVDGQPYKGFAKNVITELEKLSSNNTNATGAPAGTDSPTSPTDTTSTNNPVDTTSTPTPTPIPTPTDNSSTNTTKSYTHDDFVKESDNKSMEYNGTTFTMPNIKTATETQLYDFLKNLVLARNGLWLSEDKRTNFISIRREIDKESSSTTKDTKYNDTFFVCWKENGTKNVKKYIGSTEPGNLDPNAHGKLLPQTVNMFLGEHEGQTTGTTFAFRTENTYRQEINSAKDYFSSGDSGLNIHYGHPGISGMPKQGDYQSSDNKLKKNAGNGGYSEEEFAAAIIVIKVLRILCQWGGGKAATSLSAYKYLESQTKTFTRSAVLTDQNAANPETTKRVEIKDGTTVEKTLTLASYQNFMAGATKANAVKVLVYHNSTTAATYATMSKADVITEVKKEAVWLSVVDVQLEEELNLANVDAMPGNKTFTKMTRTAQQKQEDTTAFNAKTTKASTDWQAVKSLFDTDWANHSILKNQTTLKTKLQAIKLKKGKSYEDTSLVELDNKGGQGINTAVSTWSKGCQVVLGADNFYDFMYQLVQFIPTTKQERWYYTLVESSTINGLTLNP